MIPDTKDKKPALVRSKRNAVLIQRFPYGSSATNTLNMKTPPPCYVHHLLIREEWMKDNSKPPGEKKVHRDPAAIAKDIEKEQKALEDAYYRLDKAVLDDKTDYDAVSRQIKDEIIAIQSKLIELEMTRIAAQASITPYTPPTKTREFIIVEYVPPQVQDIINQAEDRLKPLRTNLNKAYDEWFDAHTQHEAVKKELKDFAKKKQKLADARDKARADYELARRLQSTSKKDADLNKKASAMKKAFKLDAQSRLTRADKGKTSGREKLEAAQKEYSNFAFFKYREVKTREKELYKKLVEKLKEVHNITEQINNVEKNAQAAKNTLVSGSTIQMTSFEEGWDYESRTYWQNKVPTVTIELDGKTTIFPAQQSFCRENPPLINGPHPHPHLHATEPESKLDRHNPAGAASTKFKIFELHRKIFAPTKTFVGAAFGFALSGIAAVFKHIFSAFPKKRYYKVVGEACGFMPTGMKVPDRLEATLEVFPADVYTIAIKTQPGFGYDNVMRDEKIANTTNIQGEVAYSDAENAASTADHIVSSGESFSVLGVVQSSSTTTVTKSDGYINKDGDYVPPREIKTTTTLTRDGVFGTATVTDVSTGTFDGGQTSYSSTMVREQTSGRPLTDSEKLVSLNQQYTDQSGVVTDASKTVDSEGRATAIEGDGSGEDAGTSSGRPPAVPPRYMPQIPIDFVLTRNGVEDPLTENLRQTLGMIIFLVKKCADIVGRMGNFMPSVGWKYGFSMTFLTGSLAYTHGHREHVDKRVWLHHKFDLDLNLVTAKIYVFGGAAVEFLLFYFQIGLEVYVKGLIGVKGNFETTHPDAAKGWEIGFGPTGGIGIGAEAKAIAGQPDWISASGTIETGVAVEAMYWLKKEGEDAPYLDVNFKWEGVKLKGVAHIILVGHWEKEFPICDEREIWSGRFPKEQKEEEMKRMLADQNKELQESYKERMKEAQKREKKLKEQKAKLAKIKK